MADKTDQGVPTRVSRGEPTRRSDGSPAQGEMQGQADPFGLPPDTKVLDKYVIEKPLGARGQGGEADLYFCRLPDGLQAIAKVYRPNYAPVTRALDIIRSLDHHNMLQVIDYGYCGGKFVEVSEYAEGGTLMDRAEKSPFSEEELIHDILPQLANALKILHQNQLVHRDIRPENLFFRDAGQENVILGDLGLVATGSKSLRCSFVPGFHPEYSAPELYVVRKEEREEKEKQVISEEKEQQYYTISCDYYSLGLVLIALLIGRSPFHKTEPGYILYRKLSGDIPWPNCSENFLQLLQGLAYPLPGERWGAEQVDLWSQGLPVQPPNYEMLRRGSFEVKLDGNIATTPKELGTLLYQNFNGALVRLGENVLYDRLLQLDQDLALMVRQAVNQTPTLEAALTRIIFTLNRSLPYRLDEHGEAGTPEELAELIDLNDETWEAGRNHLFEGRIPAWLAAIDDYHSRVDAWHQVERQFGSADLQNSGLETFLHILDPTLPSPTINVSPSLVDLGRIPTGERRNARLCIYNVGRGHLSGTVDISPSIPGFTVSPNHFEGRESTVNIVVVSSGDEFGVHEATALITSSARTANRILIRFVHTNEAEVASQVDHYKERISGAKAIIASAWITVGVALGILILVFLLAQGCASLSNSMMGDHPTVSGKFLQVLLGGLGSIGAIIFGLTAYLGVAIVSVLTFIKLILTLGGMVRIARWNTDIARARASLIGPKPKPTNPLYPWIPVAIFVTLFICAITGGSFFLKGILQKRSAANQAATQQAQAQVAEQSRLDEANRIAERNRVKAGVVGEWYWSDGSSGQQTTLSITKNGNKYQAKIFEQSKGSTRKGSQILRATLLGDNQMRLINDNAGRFANPLKYYPSDFTNGAWADLSADNNFLTVRFSEARGGRSLLMSRKGLASNSYNEAEASDFLVTNQENRERQPSGELMRSGASSAQSEATGNGYVGLSPLELSQKGDAAYAAERFDEAGKLYSAVLRSVPDDPVSAARLREIADRKQRNEKTRKEIAGCWTGQFGNVPFAKLTIGADGSLLVRMPTGGETFRGNLDSGYLRPEAFSATLNGGHEMPRAALRFRFDAIPQTLTGTISDATGGTEEQIALERCLD